MNNEQALQIIEQALEIANGKGAFKLVESNTILAALTTIKNVLQEPVVDKESINTETKE
mgnify:CR=1 FL=1